MKKVVCILVCTAMLLSLFGCSQVVEQTEPQLWEEHTASTERKPEIKPTEGTVPVENTQPTEPSAIVAPPEKEFLVAVTLNPGSNELLSDDNSEIFSFKYQDVTVWIPEYPDAAQRIMDDMDAGIHSAWDAAQSLRSWAQEEYDESKQDWVAYYSRILYRPQRLDTRVFSLSGEVDDFSGGAHPNVTAISATYETKTGKALSLMDIVINVDMLVPLQTLTLEKVVQLSETVELFDYQDAVAARFDLTNPASSCWYFSEDGLVFYFSPYEVAAYGQGVVTVEISYGSLKGILKEQYFPASFDNVENYSINAAKVDQIDFNSFDTTFNVQMDNGGEQIAIFTHTKLYQVMLSTGYWNAFDDQFHVEQILFAANRMTDQELLMVQTFIPDTLPNLKLTTNNGSEVETLYISQSGKDGSILLLDPGSLA